MEYDQLVRLIQVEELDRGGYERTSLVVRGADMPGPGGSSDWGITIEGAAGTSSTIAAQVLASVAELDGQMDYPPPFEFDESRGIYSWGADGASWDAVLTIGSVVGSVALAELIRGLRMRLATRVAENAPYEPLSNQQALGYATAYLESQVELENHEPVPSDRFTLISEHHEDITHTFEFEVDHWRLTVRLEAAPGHPLMKSWSRRRVERP